MRNQRQASLQAITLETVATTAKAAEHAVRAYRAGGHRLIAVIQSQITAPAAHRAERVAPRLADVVRRSSSQAGALAGQGIDAVSDRSDAVIGAASTGVAAQVKRMAGLAEGVTNPVIAQGLDAAARLSLPGAQAALALTERVATLAARLPQAAQPAKRVKRTKAQPTLTQQPVKALRAKVAGTRSTVKRAVKSVAQSVEKTIDKAQVKTAAKPAPKAVRAVAKPAVKASTKPAVKPAAKPATRRATSSRKPNPVQALVKAVAPTTTATATAA